MNNIVANFDQILEFAKDTGVPAEKKRGIVREYLQTKFIASLYVYPQARKLAFVGGTGLRLLRNLPRFSQDLDFDNLGLEEAEWRKLIARVVKGFRQENIAVELVVNELRLPRLLFDLQITTNPKEKLMIKVDSSRQWQGQQPEVVLLNRYGFIEQIVTNPLNQILVQKLAAYVARSQTQPRDIYDVVWLYSRGARVDPDFAGANQWADVVEKAKEKLKREGIMAAMERKLTPFLFEETEAKKLKLLEQVLKKLE